LSNYRFAGRRQRTRSLEERGAELFWLARERGLEGIIAKSKTSVTDREGGHRISIPDDRTFETEGEAIE
jgi:hypothetical protein